MASLHDVAERASVSICTVSRVLNRSKGYKKTSPASIERVLRAAEEVGYRTNYHARSLQTGRADAVGLMLRHSTDQQRADGFLSALVGAACQSAQRQGLHLVTTGYREDEPGDYLRFLSEKRVDGVLLPGFFCSQPLIESLEDGEAPAVLMNYTGETRLPVVNLDFAAGVAKAVHHLAELGHRSILWVGPDPQLHEDGKRRYNAFSRCMAESHLEQQELFLPPPDRSEGVAGEVEQARQGGKKLLQQPLEFTAILCYHEIIALGVMGALKENGINIPGEVSVVGFDDVYGILASPSMTVVSHMFDEIADQAIALLLAMREAGQVQPFYNRRQTITPNLVIRRSTSEWKGETK